MEDYLLFRKQNEKQIEKYTDEESKIKTNILEDVYNNKKLENEQTIQQPTLEKLESKEKITTGDPVDTSDVFRTIKKFKR